MKIIKKISFAAGVAVAVPIALLSGVALLACCIGVIDGFDPHE